MPTLREDPARTYEAMDFESRESYRKRVAFIAHRSDCSETEVAKALSILRVKAQRIRLKIHASTAVEFMSDTISSTRIQAARFCKLDFIPGSLTGRAR